MPETATTTSTTNPTVASRLCERCKPPRQIALRGWDRHQEKHDRLEGKVQPQLPPNTVVKTPMDERSFLAGFEQGWKLRGDLLADIK